MTVSIFYDVRKRIVATLPFIMFSRKQISADSSLLSVVGVQMLKAQKSMYYDGNCK